MLRTIITARAELITTIATESMDQVSQGSLKQLLEVATIESQFVVFIAITWLHCSFLYSHSHTSLVLCTLHLKVLSSRILKHHSDFKYCL